MSVTDDLHIIIPDDDDIDTQTLNENIDNYNKLHYDVLELERRRDIISRSDDVEYILFKDEICTIDKQLYEIEKYSKILGTKLKDNSVYMELLDCFNSLNIRFKAHKKNMEYSKREFKYQRDSFNERIKLMKSKIRA
tara:strand:- start:99 stop:509 length:411 start_codon:yes stop_codon:yes gene_type:complete